MDENYLQDLEQRLADAEKELKNSNLDLRIQDLQNLNQNQKGWIKDYQDEVNKLIRDVNNIAKIRESLPNGCFRRSRLEP